MKGKTQGACRYQAAIFKGMKIEGKKVRKVIRVKGRENERTTESV